MRRKLTLHKQICLDVPNSYHGTEHFGKLHKGHHEQNRATHLTENSGRSKDEDRVLSNDQPRPRSFLTSDSFRTSEIRHDCGQSNGLAIQTMHVHLAPK